MVAIMIDLLAAWYANRNFPSPLKAMGFVVFFAALGAFISGALGGAMYEFVYGASDNGQAAMILLGMILHPVFALMAFGVFRTFSGIKKRKQQ